MGISVQSAAAHMHLQQARQRFTNHHSTHTTSCTINPSLQLQCGCHRPICSACRPIYTRIEHSHDCHPHMVRLAFDVCITNCRATIADAELAVPCMGKSIIPSLNHSGILLNEWRTARELGNSVTGSLTIESLTLKQEDIAPAAH